MKYRLKIKLTSLLVSLIIVLSIPIQSFAVSVDDNGNAGSGTGGGTSNSAYTWTQNQSGFRLAIVDNQFKQVSNTVDLLFSVPSSKGLGWGNNLYTNSRAGALSTGQSNWRQVQLQTLKDDSKGEIATLPAQPIHYEGSKSVAGGEAFKLWFLNGKGSLNEEVGGGSSRTQQQQTGSKSGTTRPVLKDVPSPVNDMPPVSTMSLQFSSSQRTLVRADALKYVNQQGYASHANSLAIPKSKAIKSNILLRSQKETKEPKTIAIEELVKAWDYCQSVGKTYAESVYMYCVIIDNVQSGSGSMVASIENTMFNMASSLDIVLEAIPLQGTTENGYADKVLNWKDATTGKRLFYFLDSSLNTLEPTKVIRQNNYYVIVEPIFWYRPAAAGAGGLPSSPMHPNYVYGTISNWVDFHNSQGNKFGSRGGAYTTNMTGLGWSCFHINIDWTSSSGERLLAPVGDPNQKPDLATLKHHLDNRKGFGIHVYTTDPMTDDVQVTGYPSWKYPEAAPDPTPNKSDTNAKDNLKAPKGYNKEYNILKYYEDVYTEDGTIDQVGSFLRIGNPPEIKIVSEQYYQVKGWFITNEDIIKEPVGYETFKDAKESLSPTRSGNSDSKVFLEEGKDKGTATHEGERTLVVLLQKAVNPAEASGPLTLGESEISKSITTMDTTIPNWGPRTFAFHYDKMSGRDEHKINGVWHSCNAVWGDPNYRYVIENSAVIDDRLEANSAGGIFAAKILNNIKSGSANKAGGINNLDTAEYQTTLWRGSDVPTIASYKESDTNPLRTLLNRYGKEPAGDRHQNGVYKRNFVASLSVADESDLETHTNHSAVDRTWHTSRHNAPPVERHQGEVSVNVFRGSNNKSPGNETVTTEIPTTTPFGATSSMHSSGFMNQQITPIYFYPYVRMTYMTTGSDEKVPVNVLSQFYSEILPNDFAEAAWFNDNEQESLTMSSTQWSVHARATNDDNPWGGKNKVLPGGAIFNLSTKAHTSKVALVTWQSIVEPSVRNSLYNVLPSNEYTLSKATAEHKSYVNEAKEVLEQLRIVQWVNTNPSASTAWSGTGSKVKIKEGGQSLTALGLNNKTSTDPKHRLTADGRGDAANQGDIDVMADNPSQDVFYKVFAAPDGKIYMAKSIGSLAALKDINGTNPTGSGGVTVTQILSQTDKVTDISSKLTGEAEELNKRTLIVTNIVKALERNRGSDNVTWVSNGRWYNESMDGIVVVRKCNILTVGLGNTSIRVSALDPNLCPPSNGRGDILTKAYKSQFRLDERSDSQAAAGKAPGFIGTFQGKDIRLPDMTNLYISRPFIISNINVQDLY